MQRFFKRFLGRLYYIKTGHRINWNCVEDTILFCFKHISKLFTWISVEKVRKLKNVSYTTSSKGDSYKGYYARSNRISRSSMCTHLATGAGTSWLCRALQQNSGRGSHQLQKAGGSEERQEKAAQRHMNSKRTTHILSEMKMRLKKVNDMHQDNSNILFTCHSSVKWDACTIYTWQELLKWHEIYIHSHNIA